MVRKKTTVSTQLENIDYRTNSNEWDNLDNGTFVRKYRLLKLTLLEIKFKQTSFWRGNRDS